MHIVTYKLRIADWGEGAYPHGREGLAQAEILYSRGLSIDPNYAPTLCNYGSLLACKGAGSELAETLIKECLGFSDTAYSEQMARWGHAREGLAQADILYSLALESDPMHSVTLFNYAYMLHNEKTEGSALAAAVIKARLGVDQETYRQQLEIWGGKWREGLLQADILYSLALQMDIKNPIFLYNYATLLLSQNCARSIFEASAKAAIESISVGEGEVVALTNAKLADNMLKSGNFQEAILKYSESVELNPNLMSAYANRAVCYLKLKEPKKCVEDLVQAIEILESGPLLTNYKQLFKLLLKHAAVQEMMGCIASAKEDYIELREKALEVAQETRKQVNKLLLNGLTINAIDEKIAILQEKLSELRAQGDVQKGLSGIRHPASKRGEEVRERVIEKEGEGGMNTTEYSLHQNLITGAFENSSNRGNDDNASQALSLEISILSSTYGK